MPRNDFGFNDDFEKNPVVRMTGSAAKQMAKGTGHQIKKAAQAVASQTSGTTAPPVPAVDDQRSDTNAQKLGSQTSSLYKSQQAVQAFSSKADTATTAQKSEEERERISKVRKQLFVHKINYIDKDNILRKSGDLGDFDRELREEEEKRKQIEQKRRREEQEEEERVKQKKEQEQKKRFVAPKGKRSRMRMGRPDVTYAQRKAEIKGQTTA